MSKINWGIIGLGNIANIFADAFKFSNKGNLLAISSKNEKKLKDFKIKFKIENKYTFNNYDNLIEDKDIDIIYIAVPNSMHFEIILKCIKNNKIVLVEKPATINLKEAKIISSALKKKNLLFGEAFMYKFNPQINKTLELIKNNEIGEIIKFESNFGNDILTSFKFLGIKIPKKIDQNKRLFNKDLGGGSILDLGSYCVSLCCLISSLSSSVTKYEVLSKKNELCSSGVDIDSFVELEINGNFIAKLNASFKKNIGRESKILGTKGELIIPDTWFGKTPYIMLKKNKLNKIEVSNDFNNYAKEIDFISDCLLNNIKVPSYPGTNINDTIINMNILDSWLD